MKKFIKSIALVLAVMLVGIVFVACTPSSLEDAREVMEEKGYDVELQYADSNDDGIVGAIIATKGSILDVSNMQVLTATLFESKDDAEDMYEELMEDTSGADQEGQKVRLEGKWILVGTPAAIEAFLD